MLKIDLNRIEPASDGSHNWPLKITATGSEITSSIFVYRASGAAGDTFECVSSLSQLSELPEQAAVPLSENLQIPFYRRAEALFNCRSVTEREQVWTKVQEHVQDLLDNFKKLQDANITANSVTITPRP